MPYLSVKKCVDMCIHLDTIWALVRQMDRHTDRTGTTISRSACIACWHTKESFQIKHQLTKQWVSTTANGQSEIMIALAYTCVDKEKWFKELKTKKITLTDVSSITTTVYPIQSSGTSTCFCDVHTCWVDQQLKGMCITREVGRHYQTCHLQTMFLPSYTVYTAQGSQLGMCAAPVM